MPKMGAPFGESHGKVTVPDSTVKEIRDRYFDQGHTMLNLAAEYEIPYDTITDWIAMKTRVLIQQESGSDCIREEGA